jgi:hypothetical protein
MRQPKGAHRPFLFRSFLIFVSLLFNGVSLGIGRETEQRLRSFEAW